MKRTRTIGRMRRRSDKPMRLMQRDLTVFAALAKVRGGPIQTTDFVGLPFPSRPIASRRLRKLVDGKYLRAFIVDANLDNVYYLDTRGWDALGDHAPPPGQRPRIPSSNPPMDAHKAYLVRFWSRMVVACHQAPSAQLTRFSFEWDLLGDGLPTLTPYRPDAVCTIDDGGDRAKAYFIEVDRATESAKYVAERKLTTFDRVQATKAAVGGVVPMWLVLVVPTLRRLRAISRAYSGQNHNILGYVMKPTAREITLDTAWYSLPELRTPSPTVYRLVQTKAGAA